MNIERSGVAAFAVSLRFPYENISSKLHRPTTGIVAAHTNESSTLVSLVNHMKLTRLASDKTHIPRLVRYL